MLFCTFNEKILFSFHVFTGKWDYSAAALIVQEAGGRVTDFCGNGHFMDGHHIIATNGYLHSVYQQLIAEVPPLDM